MFKQKPRPLKPVIIWLLILLVLTSLACSLGEDSSNIIHIKTLGRLSAPATAVTVVEAPAETVIEEGPIAVVPANNPSTTREDIASTIAPTHTPLPPVVPATKSQVVTGSSPQNVESSPTSLDAVPGTTAGEHKPSLAFVALPKSTPKSTSSHLPAHPGATATPYPTPTSIAAEPVVPPEETELVTPPMVEGWSFVGVRASLDGEDSVVVGELVNNTGIPQTDIYVSGTFYGKNDHIIEEEIDTLSYVPVEVVPVGAHVPFELMIESTEPIIRLDLYAMSEPSGGAPNQDFQFSNVSQWVDTSNLYCLGGQIKNAVSQLEDYLVILASGYDNQGQLIGFEEYAVGSPQDVIGDQTSPFEMCIDPLDKQIAHYELRALGR